MPLVIVAGILVAAYLIGKKTRPQVLSLDAQEALAPAPFSDQGAQDDLTPGDIDNSYIVLDMPATDGSNPNILWNWTEPDDPTKPGHRYTDPRKKPKHHKKGGSEEMRVGCANIKNFPDMSPDKVKADGKTVGQHSTIWGGQEIQPNEDAPVILKGLESNNQPWSVVLAEFAEPIFFRTDLWDSFDQYHIRTEHPASLPGAHGLWDAITSSAFKSRKNPDLNPFAIVNSHLIVGAFNGQHSAHDRRILRAQWDKEWNDFRNVINYHFSKGRSVFFMGDLNRALPPVPYRGSRWITAHVGIDHIGFMGNPHSIKFTIRGNPVGERIPLNSDHDMRAIRGALSNR